MMVVMFIASEREPKFKENTTGPGNTLVAIPENVVT